MHRAPGTPIPQYPLPPGFRFAMFRDGNETDWARIEASVGEFDSEFAALIYFKENYIPHSDELKRRLLFVETDDGLKVATANAWWSVITPPRRKWLPRLFQMSHNETFEDRRAWLHWIAADPKYQGLGLGKAVVARALELMREIEGDVDMYLRTQTWSYKAINIYKKFGFEPTDEKKLYIYGNIKPSAYKKALKILDRLGKK